MRHSRVITLCGVLAIAVAAAAIGGASTSRSGKTAHKRVATAPRAAMGSLRLGPTEPAVAKAVSRGASTTSVGSGWNAAVPLRGARKRLTSCTDSWSGATDSAGLLYHGCGAKIHVRAANGAFREAISTGETAPIARRDVAVSPDGKFVYYTVGDRVDTGLTAAQLSAGWGSVHRMKLVVSSTGARTWKRDRSFNLPATTFHNRTDAWSMRYLTVGPDGTLYASVNAFIFAIDANGTVRADENGQYDAAGAQIGPAIAGYSSFGSLSEFRIVEGIAASGSYLYAVDEAQYVLVRFARNAAGAWVVDKMVGTPGVASGTCADANFAAPYDIGAFNGGILVADTTCGRIRQFTQDLDELETMLRIGGCNLCFKPHGVAVSATGSVVLPYRNELYSKR